MTNRHCFKSQGLDHITANYPNRRVISLIEQEPVKEDEIEEEQEDKTEDEQEENQEQFGEEADEGEMLVLI